jgi:hypothetical protein
VAAQPALLAIADAGRQRALFDGLVSELALERALQEEADRAAAAFMALLAEASQPPIGPSSSWPLVKPQVWRDPRYAAVPERTRRQLFDEYGAQLRAVAEAEAAAVAAARAAAQAAAAAAAPPPPPPPETAAPAAAASAATSSASGALVPGREEAEAQAQEQGGLLDAATLARMRAEQARLRLQYTRMEAQLREMEARLAAQQQLARSGEVDGSDDDAAGVALGGSEALNELLARGGAGGLLSSVDEERDGALVYRFASVQEESDGALVFKFDGGSGGGGGGSPSGSGRSPPAGQ